MKPFHVTVKTPEEAIKILDTLAFYDIFQFENNIKPDYCNAGGLECFSGGVWCEWSSGDGEDIREFGDRLAGELEDASH